MRTSSRELTEALGDWRSGPGPAHVRLAERIRLLVVDGRLPLGTLLPGERDLAGSLGLSRTTVSTSYRALREQGYLGARDRARGETRLPSRDAPVPAGPGTAGRVAGGVVDLARASSPAPEGHLHRAYATALEGLARHLPGHGYDMDAGVGEARAAVADRFTARGLPTAADQILITNGAQHALVLLIRTLLRPRDRIVVEHPTYPHALRAFRDAHCRLLPVPLTDDGWDPDRLERATRDAALAYLLPDHHNPTGLRMADDVRERLRAHCPVVVDETTAELVLDGVPARPLAASLPGAITIGSTSKTFWGGLRVGWIRADRDLLRRLVRARSGLDLGTPVVEQLATAALLRDVGEILPGRLDTLRRRRAHLRDLLAAHLPGWSAAPGAGGLSLWARLPGPYSSSLAATAPAYGVQVAAGPRFGVGGAFERFLRLPYCLPPDALTAAVTGLRRAASALDDGRPGPVDPADPADVV